MPLLIYFRVIATVLHWDIKELQTRVTKITKDRACPSKDVLGALDTYVQATGEKQEDIRRQSQSSSTSIVLVILADAGKPSDIKEETHKLALDYLACKLSIRDREEITRVACHSHPDHLTTMVRALFDAYEPIIRQFHNAVDLSDTVADFQAFIVDMLKVARIQPPGSDGQTIVPSVGDFVQLLKKHQYSSHKFIHQLCKNGGEVTQWYLKWAKQAASQFQRHSDFVDASESQHADENQDDHKEGERNAGDLAKPLNELFNALSSEKQSQILPILDDAALYVNEEHASSLKRLSEVIHSSPTAAQKSSTISKVLNHRLPLSRTSSRPSSPARSNTVEDAQAQTQKPPTSVSHDSAEVPRVSSNPGPGAYLARWQDLLDSTPITPLTLDGKVKSASDKEVVKKSATDVDGGQAVEFKTSGKALDAQKVKPSVPGGGTPSKEKTVKKPDVKPVIDALGVDFRKLLAEKSLAW